MATETKEQKTETKSAKQKLVTFNTVSARQTFCYTKRFDGSDVLIAEIRTECGRISVNFLSSKLPDGLKNEIIEKYNEMCK